MKILLGVQSRSVSTRFPNKHAALVGGIPMLKRICNTCCSVSVYPKVNEFHTVAIVPDDDGEIQEFCKNFGIAYYTGDPKDLISRYMNALKPDTDAIVRVTGDCPLIPKGIIEDVVRGLMEADYVTNVSPRTYPDGYDCQGISVKGLEWVYEHQKDEREHPFKPLDENPNFLKRFLDNGFTVRRIINPQKIIMNPYHSENKLSVDTEEDLERLNAMLKGKK